MKHQIVEMAMKASVAFAIQRGCCTLVLPRSSRKQKKEPHLHPVNRAVWWQLPPEQVEVDICCREELAQREGPATELDEMWGSVPF